MKRASVVLLALVSSPVLFADVPQRLIPAGSLISCTISEPRLSSKTEKVGDPVLCQVAHTSRYGHSLMPWRSYLVGRFEDFKDPGHFVGKGFMELRFDRMVIEPDIELPVDARVVDVPGYKIDNTGRILGKGHATRDTIEWMIPVLWPIDLINLPRRGPRPTLKEETRVTLKVMDDLAVPMNNGPFKDEYGLSHREPTAQLQAPPPAAAPQVVPQMAQQQVAPQPQYVAYPPAPQVQYVYAPVQYVYVPAPMMVVAAPVVTYMAPMMVAMPMYAPQPYGYAAPAPEAYSYAPAQQSYSYAPASQGYGYAAPGQYASRAYPPVRNYGYSGVRITRAVRPTYALRAAMQVQ